MPPFPSVKLSEIMAGFNIQGNRFRDKMTRVLLLLVILLSHCCILFRGIMWKLQILKSLVAQQRYISYLDKEGKKKGDRQCNQM